MLNKVSPVDILVLQIELIVAYLSSNGQEPHEYFSIRVFQNWKMELILVLFREDTEGIVLR